MRVKLPEWLNFELWPAMRKRKQLLAQGGARFVLLADMGAPSARHKFLGLQGSLFLYGAPPKASKLSWQEMRSLIDHGERAEIKLRKQVVSPGKVFSRAIEVADTLPPEERVRVRSVLLGG